MQPTFLSAMDWTSSRGDKWTAQLPAMEAMLRPVDAPLLDALQLRTPSRIADIGCGGGGTALEILRRAPAPSVVHGFDLSPSVIAMARRRMPSADGALAFEVADLGTAPAPQPRYDRLVSRFGIMFFDDPPAAFRNLAGWLIPGGRFAFAVWGPVEENPWMEEPRSTVAGMVPLPDPDPDGPGTFRYADTHGLLPLLQAAGFRNLAAHDWRGTLPLGGGLPAAEAAGFALAALSNFAEVLQAGGAEAMAEARLRLTARLSKYEHEGIVRMNACVRIVTGTA